MRFPFGTEEKYDYITVNTFDRFGQLEHPFADLGEIFKKVHPNMKVDDKCGVIVCMFTPFYLSRSDCRW